MTLNIHKKQYSRRYADGHANFGVDDGNGDCVGDGVADGGNVRWELGMKGLHPSATPTQDIHHKNK